MRVLVTGASGFVGRHLVPHLQESGDDVVQMDMEVDICDPDAIIAAVVKVAPEVIYHMAGWAHVGDSWSAPAAVYRVNTLGTANVLQAAMAAGKPRVLVVGSADAYGPPSPKDLPLREDTPLRPLSPYGASKAAAEVIAERCYRAEGLPVVMTRSFNHTGPGQHPSFLVPALARRIAKAKAEGVTTIPIGNMEAKRDMLDVLDVVRAYRLLGTRGQPGQAYNVSSGEAVAVSQFVDRMVAMAGGDLRAEVDPELVRPVDVPVVVGDSSRLRNDTGWEPAHTLDQTLRRVLEAAMEASGA